MTDPWATSSEHLHSLRAHPLPVKRTDAGLGEGPERDVLRLHRPGLLHCRGESFCVFVSIMCPFINVFVCPFVRPDVTV